MGAAPPMTRAFANDARNVARSGRAEGRAGSVGASGGAVREPPPPPPARLARRQQAAPGARGCPATPTERVRQGGMRRRRKGGWVGSRRPPPQIESRGATARPPPLSPLPPPPARKPRGRRPEHPEGSRDDSPSPRQDRGAREGGRSRARPHAPAACSRRNQGEQANPRQRARAPHSPRPETASEHEPERYGGHALHGESDASDTRFVACPGKAEGRTEAGQPPPHWPPWPHSWGARRTGRPPPHTPHPPTQERPRRADPPRGERTGPSQVGGKRDRAAPPPQASQTEHGTGAGHAQGHGPRGTALPAPITGTARGAHATPTGEAGRRGADTARARAQTNTHKGHAGNTRRATGPSPRNAQTAWNGVPASEGKGHPDGTARHTQRRTHGAERGKRGRKDTRYRPEPPEPAASAAHTRPGHCTRQGSSGALRHAPPQG